MTAYTVTPPGHVWVTTSRLICPLPAYTWIGKDGGIRVAVRKGLAHLWLRYWLEAVTDWLHALALLLAGVALVDGWRCGKARGVIVGDLRQLGLFERVA